MPQVHLFATRDDWLEVFQLVESSAALQYVRYGQDATAAFTLILHGRDLPGLGTAAGEQTVACDTWVVALRDTELRARPIDRDDGTRVYAMDQLWNPDTTVVNTGGIHGEAILINSNVGTLATEGVGMQLQRRFTSRIKQVSERIGAFWVAPEALARLKAGWRLCGAVSSPPEYDLRRPD